jgi:transposase-like protein
MRPYSEAVKADVRRRMSPPHRQSVTEIAQELGIHVITLYKWRKAWRLQGEVVPATQKAPENWGAADKFTVVLETAGLNDTELGAYCQERGLYPEQVDRWRQAAQDANALPQADDGRAEGFGETPPAGSAGDQAAATGAPAEGQGLGGRADSNLPLCAHVPSSSEELSPELIGVSAWDLNHNRGLAPLSNHFKAALDPLPQCGCRSKDCATWFTISSRATRNLPRHRMRASSRTPERRATAITPA